MPLLYALRMMFGLHNPHFGCGLAQCGACTVHVGGEPTRSCVTPLSAWRPGQYRYTAGLGTRKAAPPRLAARLLRRGAGAAMRCYCTHGWLMTCSAAFLARQKDVRGEGGEQGPLSD